MINAFFFRRLMHCENAKGYDWDEITESCECYYNQSQRGE